MTGLSPKAMVPDLPVPSCDVQDDADTKHRGEWVPDPSYVLVCKLGKLNKSDSLLPVCFTDFFPSNVSPVDASIE